MTLSEINKLLKEHHYNVYSRQELRITYELPKKTGFIGCFVMVITPVLALVRGRIFAAGFFVLLGILYLMWESIQESPLFRVRNESVILTNDEIIVEGVGFKNRFKKEEIVKISLTPITNSNGIKIFQLIALAKSFEQISLLEVACKENMFENISNTLVEEINKIWNADFILQKL